MSAGLTFEGLRKTFTGEAGTVTAVDGVSGVIAPGKITGLVGPDAAGKTTLIRMLAGLLVPNAGTITKPPGHVSYMPQKFGLYEDLTVEQNLVLYADLHGLDQKARKETFAKLHGFTGLAPFTDRLAGKLSGGMKQKLGLACTLVVTPEVLLLDEPSVGVDPVSRRELWAMVQQLQNTGIAVLWSTAYLDEAERCDHVMLLHEGTMLFDGAPKDFTARSEGQTWRMALPAKAAEKRELQRAAAALPGVIDSQIQGRALRLVVEKDAPAPTLPGLTAEQIPPRLEDAYLAMLHPPHKPPPIVEHTEEVGSGELIRVHDLTRKFGAFTAVDHLSFEVQRGEIFGLLGPNGAGKSTTFKMLCGLIPASSGEAHVAGFDLRVARADARGRLGYMAQKFAYVGYLSVEQNMRFAAGVYGLSKKEANERVEEAIDAFGLAPYRSSACGLLPLGIKQRMALACAILHRPAILFLDEPTSGVDPVTRHEFWARINAMADAGMTVLVTSHFIDEAEYCDRLAIIYRGKMIGLGSPEEIKAQHDKGGAGLEAAFISLVENYDREHPQ